MNKIENPNTNTLQGRLKFGLGNEIFFLEIIENLGIHLEGNNNDTDDRFNWCDFTYKKNNLNIFIELKSRTISKDRFDTSILAINKVQSYKKNKIKDEKNIFLIVFGFVKQEDMEYFYLKYDKELFKTFETREIFNKLHYKIPINLLKPVDIILNEFI